MRATKRDSSMKVRYWGTFAIGVLAVSSAGISNADPCGEDASARFSLVLVNECADPEADTCCLNSEDDVVIQVWLNHLVPAGRPYTGAQFFLEWNPDCWQLDPTNGVVANWGVPGPVRWDDDLGRLDFFTNVPTPETGEQLLATLTFEPTGDTGMCEPEFGFAYRDYLYMAYPNRLGIPVGDGSLTYDDGELDLCPNTPDPCIPPEGDPVGCAWKPLVFDFDAPVIEGPTNLQIELPINDCSVTLDDNDLPCACESVLGNCTCIRDDGESCTGDDGNGQEYGPGAYNLLWTCSDDCGNEAELATTITVWDVWPPNLTCPADPAPVMVGSDQCEAFVDIGTASCIDACDCQIGMMRSDDPDLGPEDPFPVGCTTVTWVAWDGVNKETCEQLVCVIDDEDPSIACPHNVVEEVATNECAWSPDETGIGTPITNDNCPDSLTTPTCATNREGVSCDGPFPVGQTVVEWCVTDGGIDGLDAPNEACCTHFVIITDPEPPVINECPDRIDVDNATETCEAEITLTDPEWSDNCEDNVVVTCIRSDAEPCCVRNGEGACEPEAFPVGDTTVTWIVHDGSHSATCDQIVAVADVETAEISDWPEDLVGDLAVPNDPGACDAVVEIGAPTVQDNCPDNTTITCTRDDGAPCCIGGADAGCNPVPFPVTDPEGHPDNCVAVTVCINEGQFDEACRDHKVCVFDNEPPSFACPADVVIDATAGACYAEVSIDQPDYTDNCSANTTCACTRSDGFPCDEPFYGSDEHCSYTPTVVTWTCSDGVNADDCTFTVTVMDNESPNVVAPGDIIKNAPLGQCEIEVDPGMAACKDNCGARAGYPVCFRDDGRSCWDTYPIGETTLTWLCNDCSMNQDHQTQTITVRHGFTPEIELCHDGVDFPDDFTLPMTFEFADCDTGDTFSWCYEMEFVNRGLSEPPLGGGMFIEVPRYDNSGNDLCEMDITCLSVKDMFHSLRRTVYLPTNWPLADGEPDIDAFVGLLEDHDECLPLGDVDNSNTVDVTDWAIVVYHDERVCDPAYCEVLPAYCDTAPPTDALRPDINGDFVICQNCPTIPLAANDYFVLNETLGLAPGDPRCCDAAAAVASPAHEVPIATLIEMGLDDARKIDFDSNGVFDYVDVTLFLMGAEPATTVEALKRTKVSRDLSVPRVR